MRSNQTPNASVRPPRGFNKAVLIGGIAVVLVLALIAIGVALSSGSDTAEPANLVQWQTVATAGTALTVQPPDKSTAADSAIGMAAPQLTGESFDGTPVKVGDDGRAKVVMFVAHWCPHCQREVPLISKWISGHQAKYNIDYYAVSTAADATQPNFPPSKWLAKTKLPATIMADDRTSTAAAAFGIRAYPYLVFINGQGKVVSRASGEIPMSDFENRVKAASA